MVQLIEDNVLLKIEIEIEVIIKSYWINESNKRLGKTLIRKKKTKRKLPNNSERDNSKKMQTMRTGEDKTEQSLKIIVTWSKKTKQYKNT